MTDTLGIDLHQTECTYQGYCSGTCPKCKQEEEKLNRALLGGAAAVLGMSLSLTACNNISGDINIEESTYISDDITGDIEINN